MRTQLIQLVNELSKSSVIIFMSTRELMTELAVIATMQNGDVVNFLGYKIEMTEYGYEWTK